MLEKLRVGVWYFALVISALLALITFSAGHSFLRIVINAIIGFSIIYGLCILSITLFEKISAEEDFHAPGALLDVAVGQEDDLFSKEANHQDQDLGTLNPQEPLSQDKASNIRASQLNQQLEKGMPSAEKQAEIVRRMGWGE